ncbi:gamma-glutamylcyclotransferase family protein [Phenylobacterium sp.]|uniref:gamma-glutamylcyclotransferase family protein n=1 Tax=Phenylobacterium sp. TaxID=1871053 RepID=UPI00301C137D
MPRLFSYGTLQQENVQLETFGRRLDGQPDALPGFRRAMVRITDPAVIATSGSDHHPIVTPSDHPIDEVRGTVFEITEAELAAADTYEVSDYKRVAVQLRSGLDAWVYVRA